MNRNDRKVIKRHKQVNLGHFKVNAEKKKMQGEIPSRRLFVLGETLERQRKHPFAKGHCSN